MQNIHELPKDLPVPVDDGACDHLPGIALPSMKCLRGYTQMGLPHNRYLAPVRSPSLVR